MGKKTLVFARLAVVALILPACHDKNRAAPTGPQILGITPANAASGVPRGVVGYVYFDRPVSGISSSTVTLTGGSTNPTLNIFPDTICNAAVIVPIAPLEMNTTYTLSLTSGITDSAGRALTAQSITFQTSGSADGTRPNNTGAPTFGNVTATSVDLSWTATSDPAGGDPPTSLIYDIFVSTTGCFRFDLPPFDSSAAGQTMKTVTGLRSNTPHQFLLRARDTAGNRGADFIPASRMTDYSYAVDVWAPIISVRCAGCHPGGGAPASLNHFPDAATSYGNLFNINAECSMAVPPLKRVLPGDSANSVLFDKLDTTTPTQCGLPMPLGRPSLPLSEQTIIRDWIDQGAHP